MPKCLCNGVLVWLANVLLKSDFQDLGVFIPPPTDLMKNDFFMSFMSRGIPFDREPVGGLADMFGQLPGMCVFIFLRKWSLLVDDDDDYYCFFFT